MPHPAAPVTGRPLLSVVIPAFNEARRIGASLAAIAAYVDAHAPDAEIVVVDDGSRDASVEVASGALRGRRGRVLRAAENRGKGHAVRRGILAAEGRWVLLTDADLSTPVEEHARLAAAARDHDLDAVVGSRALPGSRIEIRQHVIRQLMGKTFNRVVRWTTGLPFRDTQCGFKLFDRERCRPIFERMVVDRFAFDVEFLFVATRLGLRVREVPVVWRDARGSKVGLVGDPARMLVDLARIRWRFRRGLYHATGSVS
jgi:glycosyltransferase involved in cell wall biosynthesis